MDQLSQEEVEQCEKKANTLKNQEEVKLEETDLM